MLKCWHPDVFCAALLNAQPTGFYAPVRIVRDARDHGGEVLPVCINASGWDCTLKANDNGSHTVWLSMRMVRGMANTDAAMILAVRRDRPFSSADDVWRRAGVRVASLVRLAEADAFLSALSLVQREALWVIKALCDEPLSLFAAARTGDEKPLPDIDKPTPYLNPTRWAGSGGGLW